MALYSELLHSFVYVFFFLFFISECYFAFICMGFCKNVVINLLDWK